MSNLSTATVHDIPAIQAVATPAWWAVYGPILSEEQVSFMLAEFYNSAALTDLIQNQKQEFVLLKENEAVIGFAAFSLREDEPSTHKLNKLYLLPEQKGKGKGRILLDEVIKRVNDRGGRLLELNVNRYNDSQHFYQKMGFHIVYEEDIVIGEFFMNDFVMRKSW